MKVSVSSLGGAGSAVKIEIVTPSFTPSIALLANLDPGLEKVLQAHPGLQAPAAFGAPLERIAFEGVTVGHGAAVVASFEPAHALLGRPMRE